MWIFTKDGFFSVVRHFDNKSRLVIRARSKDDILRLAKILRIKAFRSKKGSDYPFRLFCSKSEWVAYLVKEANEIDYTNFKETIDKSQKFDEKRLYQLHAIWQIMSESYSWPW
jgi:hypothetical protein